MQRATFLAEPYRTRLLIALEIVLIACAGFGIIYCALQGSLLGVALSALLPGPGAVWLLTSTRASRPSDSD